MPRSAFSAFKGSGDLGSRFWQTLRLGLKSLLLHKLRSGLAILGIFIGVTAVIWLVAMGEGVSYQAQQQIKDLGANNIIIRSTKPPSDVTRGGGFVIAYGLLRDDYDRIVTNVPTLLQAVPMREIRKEARYLDKVTDVRLVGCTSKYLEMNNLQMSRGRFLTDKDLEQADNVAVIGDRTAQDLFPYEDPIGQFMQIDKEFYVDHRPDRVEDALGRHRRQPGGAGLQPRRLHSALDARARASATWWSPRAPAAARASKCN